MKLAAVFGLLGTLALSAQTLAVEIKLTPERDYLDIRTPHTNTRIERIQDQENLVDEYWAKTSRRCPPFCPQPMYAAEGVTTVGEVEVFDFIERKVNTGKGLLIDARVAAWYMRGTIPGSINIPFTEFERMPSDPELGPVMELIGAKRRTQVGFLEGSWDRARRSMGASVQRSGFWDFSDSPDLLLWCNGPWCGQSPRAIRALIELGFPTEKLYNYRGGMQMWQMFGLTVEVPSEQSQFSHVISAE